MEMEKTKKKFDAVKTMREIRDRLTRQFKGMGFQEQKQFIREQTKTRFREDRNGRSGREAV